MSHNKVSDMIEHDHTIAFQGSGSPDFLSLLRDNSMLHLTLHLQSLCYEAFDVVAWPSKSLGVSDNLRQ